MSQPITNYEDLADNSWNNLFHHYHGYRDVELGKCLCGYKISNFTMIGTVKTVRILGLLVLKMKLK